MGPLVTAQAQDRVSGYIDAGEAAGATIVVDGRQPTVDADGEGFFVGPTLFDHVTTDMSIYTDEIFGPVLSVVPVDSYEEGVKLINDNPYGNGTAIFTNDGGAARQFQNEVKVGMIGINVPFRCRWRTTPAVAGRTHCSVTLTLTGSKACTSSPAAK
jgi:malonate-semialdehyde dehydrogenase (acetylating)/methylmalonate-semialdehyde dehydrogenase